MPYVWHSGTLNFAHERKESSRLVRDRMRQPDQGMCHKYCATRCCHIAQKKPRTQCVGGCGQLVSKSGARYCSFECKNEHKTANREQTFFERGGTRGYVTPSFLARTLRRHYGERCCRCGWAQRHPKTGKVPVEVEHIDGDWENNLLSNLTLLCPNCHALTPTYRGLNRGRGRPHRLGGRDNPLANRQTKASPRSTRRREKVFPELAMQLTLLPPT